MSETIRIYRTNLRFIGSRKRGTNKLTFDSLLKNADPIISSALDLALDEKDLSEDLA